MIKSLVYLCAFLIMLALGFAWYISGVGMNETVTGIGYGVIALIALLVVDEIEEGFYDVG